MYEAGVTDKMGPTGLSFPFNKLQEVSSDENHPRWKRKRRRSLSNYSGRSSVYPASTPAGRFS